MCCKCQKPLDAFTCDLPGSYLWGYYCPYFKEVKPVIEGWHAQSHTKARNRVQIQNQIRLLLQDALNDAGTTLCKPHSGPSYTPLSSMPTNPAGQEALGDGAHHLNFPHLLQHCAPFFLVSLNNLKDGLSALFLSSPITSVHLPFVVT